MHELVLRQVNNLVSLEKEFQKLEKEQVPEVIGQLEQFIGKMIDVYFYIVPINDQGFYDKKIPSWGNSFYRNKFYKTGIKEITEINSEDGIKIAISFHYLPFLPKMLTRGLYAYNPQKELCQFGVPFLTTYYKFFNLMGKKAFAWAHLNKDDLGSKEGYSIIMGQGLLKQV